MKTSVLLTLLALVLVSPVFADRPVDETREASPDVEVTIELISGSVQVIGWDRNEVQITGTLGDDVEELDVSSSRGRISIEVVLLDRRRLRDVDADLEIHVPAGSSVESGTVSADVSVRGVSGAVELESVSGDVIIEGGVREVEAATVSGDIRFSSDDPLREGEFETVSGDIEFRAALGDRGDFSFGSVSGDIELRLPAGTSAEFSVGTFSGRIDNDLGPAAVKESRYVPAKSVEFTLGSGSARVEIESFSGRIRLLAD